MPIPRPDIQKARPLNIKPKLWGVQESEDFVFGGRVVEPDGAEVGGVGGVVGDFGIIEVVPAVRWWNVSMICNCNV